MSHDLSIYNFRPRQQHLLITVIVIAGLAVFGFVRGITSGSELAGGETPAAAGAAANVGQPATPVVLPSVTSLTPKVILPPPPPKAAAVNAPETEAAPEDEAATVANAPAPAPEAAPSNGDTAARTEPTAPPTNVGEAPAPAPAATPPPP